MENNCDEAYPYNMRLTMKNFDLFCTLLFYLYVRRKGSGKISYQRRKIFFAIVQGDLSVSMTGSKSSAFFLPTIFALFSSITESYRVLEKNFLEGNDCEGS